MTAAELYTFVKAHGFTDAATATLDAILNVVMGDVNRDRPPYLLSTANVVFNAASATPSTGFPTDFSALEALVNTSTGVRLEPTTFHQIVKSRPTALSTQGAPLFYYFVGTTLTVYPVPAAQTTLKMPYWRFQPALTSASVEADFYTPPRYHGSLIAAGMLRDLYALEDNLEASDFWAQRFDKRYGEMLAELFTLQLDKPPAIDPYYGDDYAEEAFA